MRLDQARERIDALAELNAFIYVSHEDGEGTVVAVKDVVDVRGMPTTGGGRILPGEPAEEDAPSVSTIRANGGVIVGKTNLHEWAFGVTGENPHYGPARNPCDPTRVAGGSSSGSAIAVATGMCDWAVGTDTGGSVRIPASLCGIVGFKPTVGSIDTGGVIPASKTLDTLGTLARDVRTAAAGIEMMGGPTSPSFDFRHQAAPKLAIPRGWVSGLDAETEAAWSEIVKRLPAIPFPEREIVSEPALTISLAEGAAFHKTWIEAYPRKYGEDVLERLSLGLTIPWAKYADALQRRLAIRTAVESAMQRVDGVVLPTTAVIAPKVGGTVAREALTRFTRPFSTSGHPVITLPLVTPSLPVGIQVVGHFGEDAALVTLAAQLEAEVSSWR